MGYRNVTVIAFRGTNFLELSDWLTNVDSSPYATEHGDVHGGFYEAYHKGDEGDYSSIKTQINEIVASLKNSHVWITGHSLGGALALICAYELEHRGDMEIDGIITYGQPVLVRKPFAKFLDENLIHRYARFANGKDLVTRVAPGYTYCGSLIHFTENGIRRSAPKLTMDSPTVTSTVGMSNNPDPNEIAPFTVDEFESYLERQATENLLQPTATMSPSTLDLIEDHSMANYLEKIRSLFDDK